MTRISEEKLGEILAGCEGVQFGPWSAEQCDDGLWMVCNAGDVIAFGDPNHKEPDDELPFRYLARLDPTTVSSLVTELRELKEALRTGVLVPREPTDEWAKAVDLNRNGVGAHSAGCTCGECCIRAVLAAVPHRAALSGAKL